MKAGNWGQAVIFCGVGNCEQTSLRCSFLNFPCAFHLSVLVSCLHLIRVGSPQWIRVLFPMLDSVQSSSGPNTWWKKWNALLSSPVLSQHCYLGSKLAMVRREWGLASSCSRCARSWRKWGRRARSYAQQFFMSSYRGAGQSTGGGSRYPSSMLFITFNRKQGGQP